MPLNNMNSHNFWNEIEFFSSRYYQKYKSHTDIAKNTNNTQYI